MTDTQSPQFNLVNEPWIRCLLVKGDIEELSLKDVFIRAREIRRISGDGPSQDNSILRLILAAHVRIFRLEVEDPYDAFGAWLSYFSDDTHLTRGATDYLNRHVDRFWLIHDQAPFMQVATLEAASGKVDPVSRVMVDAESDYFSVRAGKSREQLSFAEAARWLVHVHAYDYSGIKTGALGDPRVKHGKGYPIGTGWAGAIGGVVVHGGNLYETLLLNTPPAVSFREEDFEDDLPVWERQPDGPDQRNHASDAQVAVKPTGLCDILTWQSRRVRYAQNGGKVTGVLVAIGDRIDPRNEFSDPLTGTRYSKNQSKGGEDVYFPSKHNPAYALWRGIEPLLARESTALSAGAGPVAFHQPRTLSALAGLTVDELPLSAPVTIELIGVEYGTQDAVVIDVTSTTLAIELAILSANGAPLSNSIVTSAKKTLDLSYDFSIYAGMLAQAQSSAKQFARDDQATRLFLSATEQAFRTWVSGLSNAQTSLDAETSWAVQASKAARQLSDTLAQEAGDGAAIGWVDDDGQLYSTAKAQRWLNARIRAHFPTINTPDAADVAALTPPSTNTN